MINAVSRQYFSTSKVARKLTSKQKRVIDLGVKKIVKEYGETLRLLGKGERYRFAERR